MRYIIPAGIVVLLILGAFVWDCGGKGTGSDTAEEEQKQNVAKTSEELKHQPDEKNLIIEIADEDYLVDKKKMDLQSVVQVINKGIKREGFSIKVVCIRARANQYNSLIKALKEVQAVYTEEGCD